MIKAYKTIAENKQLILNRWIARVQENIPGAQKYDTPVLKNNIPHLLDALVNALQSDDSRKVVYRSETHGEERARETDYTLEQVLREYRMLKEVIFEVLDEHGDNIEIRERDGIMYAIDQAVEQSAEIFYEERTRSNQEARQEAEKLSRELEEQGLFRDRFVASLSHDLRGPLSNTHQLVELLEEHLEGMQDEFTKKILSKIRLSVVRGSELISNLLDVNRIRSGEPIPVNLQESDLLEVIQQLVKSFEPSVQRRISIESKEEKVLGYWDAEALRRAVDNLISNAIKYGDNSAQIQLTFEQLNEYISIAVHNHGNSIPPEKQEKLFDLYYRTQDVKNQKGWGLGLTLVQGVAAAHGGSVEVKSHPDDGTTFRILIPHKKA